MVAPTTKSQPTIRHIEKAELPFAVECERLSHETFDEDFQMAVWPSYMLSEAELRFMIGQYRSNSKGMKDTRFRVASALIDGKPSVVGG